MILSGRDIKWYISSGKLQIEGALDSQFQQNGIDLILDEVTDNVKNFQPLTFYLGVLREKITMPDDLMAFVQLRSTWARTGIILPPTIIDAGFCGDITLEIFNAKSDYLPVPYGERFAHIVFAKLTSPSEPYKGKYQYQEGITLPKPD